MVREKSKKVSPGTLLTFNIFTIFLQKKVLKERYGKQKTKIWLKRSREIFKSLYPRIPDIGGKENYLYKNLEMATFLMPIAIIMKEEGIPTRDIGKHLFDLSINAFKVFLPLAKKISFHEENQIIKMKMAAERSLQRTYPDDWVFEFVEGGGDYLYGYVR